MNSETCTKPNELAPDADSVKQELQTMFRELERGRPEVQPSKYWIELNKGAHGQLMATGFANFKRTLAKHYFTWTRILPWDPQIRFLVSHVPLTATIANMFRTFLPFKHQHLTLRESLACNFLSNMVWDYAERNCPAAARLAEPEIGNPLRLVRQGRLISQDLANSTLEADFIQQHLPKSVSVKRACELGAGYGRTAHVLLSQNPSWRYVIVDIPPALYVSQRYLSTLYPNRRIFRWRPFNSYNDIRGAFESSELAFLLPSQIELLPDRCLDLFINISSLHEMRIEQIRYYFTQILRMLRSGGCFYLKQWKVSHIPYENVIIRMEDYPLSEWRVLVQREARVQTHFFEALLQKPS